MAKKRGRGVSWMTHYLKSRLGYAAKIGVSPFELACIALEKDGFKRPEEYANKKWVAQNRYYIESEVAKIKAAIAVSKRSIPKQIVVARTNSQIAAELVAQRESKRPKVSKVNIKTDEFLQTYEWRKLRMEALKLHGARCQCCGASPATGAVMNVDHIKPRKLFPELALTLDNLQVLCGDCNHGKGNWDQTDWRKL